MIVDRSHARHADLVEDPPMPTASALVRARTASVLVLVLGVLLGSTLVATAGSGKKSEYGETGASPVPAAEPATAPTSLRVASFNILGWDHTERGGSKYRKGYDDGVRRMKRAVRLIRNSGIDVIGLQEFQPQQYEVWVKKASADYDIYPGYVETVGFLRNSIAWRRSEFRLVSTSWLKIPYFHGDVLRMPLVLLQSLETGQQFYVMNFQNPADVRGNAEKWRRIGQRYQIRLANQLAADNGLPILWTGDMNARSQVFCRVTKQAGMVAANGGVRTDSSCAPPRRMLVDWIFGRDVAFSGYVQDRSHKVRRISDHHFIHATATLQPRQPRFPPPSEEPSPTPTDEPTVAASLPVR
jgi:endonuclease/exonuclease/phosphatase family metal-dependent hydrolase